MTQILPEDSCQLTTTLLQLFFNVIPEKIAPDLKKSLKDITRNRKLPLPKLITFILSLVASGESKGVDINKSKVRKDSEDSFWAAAAGGFLPPAGRGCSLRGGGRL
ncbi:MAG: hypothetical protein P4L43_01185 [Syntrophobacteraceae bacterium]|nr:hypothetical protein [Syntrophobacteraceae bacterium]